MCICLFWWLRCRYFTNLKIAAQQEDKLGFLGAQSQASDGTNRNKYSEEMKQRSELDVFLDEDASARGSLGGAGKSDPWLLRGLDWSVRATYCFILVHVHLQSNSFRHTTLMRVFGFALFSSFFSCPCLLCLASSSSTGTRLVKWPMPSRGMLLTTPRLATYPMLKRSTSMRWVLLYGIDICLKALA